LSHDRDLDAFLDVRHFAFYLLGELRFVCHRNLGLPVESFDRDSLFVHRRHSAASKRRRSPSKWRRLWTLPRARKTDRHCRNNQTDCKELTLTSHTKYLPLKILVIVI
jgi:hypothetical protein